MKNRRKLCAVRIKLLLHKLGVEQYAWPEMTDIINILIRCELAHMLNLASRDVVKRKLCE